MIVSADLATASIRVFAIVEDEEELPSADRPGNRIGTRLLAAQP